MQCGLAAEADLGGDGVAISVMSDWTISSILSRKVIRYLQSLGEPRCDFRIVKHRGSLIQRDDGRSLQIPPRKRHVCVWIVARRELVVQVQVHRVHISTHAARDLEHGAEGERKLGLGRGAHLSVEYR